MALTEQQQQTIEVLWLASFSWC